MYHLKENVIPATKELTPCASGFELLQKKEFKYSLFEIKNLVSAPDDLYRKLYLHTIYRLAEFCQAMPFSEDEFNYPYGFLLRQLKLVIATLKFRRGILLPKNAKTEDIAAEEAQWTYALFSASLLKNMDEVLKRDVLRYQLQGDLIGEWSPMAESLYTNSFYYTMNFSSKASILTPDIFMASLAEHTIPFAAINWLIKNKNLFKQWWEVVLHQPTEDNEIELIIQHAGNKAGIVCETA